MSFLETLVQICAGVSAAAWAALGMHVLAVERRRRDSRRLVGDAIAALDAHADLPIGDRLARAHASLDRLSREMVMWAAGDRATSSPAFEALVVYFTRRWGMERLVQEASRHWTSRGKWRRMAGLRILARRGHPRLIELLDEAVRDADPELSSQALTLLGDLDDERAVEVLVKALRSGLLSPPQVAAHLDRTPASTAGPLRALLTDSDPLMRQWAARLLDRYAATHHLALAHDPDPGVRKAAVESLGSSATELARQTAAALLDDPVPYVRAKAARALGEMDASEHAFHIAKLLGDGDWWVRKAAKEALEAMGNDVWPVLMRCLNDPDRFVRNGAAEVFQNLGVLDNLLVMEAATSNPSFDKLEMLRRIAAAGEVRLTDTLIERAGPVVGPRVRELLDTMGLAQAG